MQQEVPVTTGSPSATRAVMPPASTAQLVLAAGVVANLVIVEILFATSGVGKNSVLTVAKFFGLHAALIMMLQLVLVSRLPWLDRRLGMDRLTAWHRWTGFALLWTVVTHATLVVLGYARLGSAPVVQTFAGLAGVTASLLGMCAAAVIVVLASLSTRYFRRRLPYEAWHALHIGLYLAVLLALVHQMLEGTTFASSPLAATYWWTLWSLVLVGLLVGRVGLPVWRNSRHRFRVAAVVPESDSVVSVHVTGRDLERLPARAGQFFIWRFPAHLGAWQANPFSLSAAPDGRSLRLTAKGVGATSRGLRGLPVGTRVFAEGPYGAFTRLNQATNGILLIAGGIGVTPIRALLEESANGAVVLYRVRTEADAVLLPELQALAQRGAQVHVLAGRTGSSSAGPFEPSRLLALVPDVASRDVFVCGPAAMTAAVLRSLRSLGVPRTQVHAERFDLA
jgi:predicted ferric reductase